MEKRKCVIFGAGERGGSEYRRFAPSFDVLAYTDNNPALWGGKKCGAVIIPPDELPKFTADTGAVIFIANELHYNEIANQLDGMGLPYYLVQHDRCCRRKNGVWFPASFARPEPYRKPDQKVFAVLFVQGKPCSRTNKIASAIKGKGVRTYSAYNLAPSDAGPRSFDEEFQFWNYSELVDFVNESEFDIIHCSNEPDILVNVLKNSRKKIVHDCHDMISLAYKKVSDESMALEYLANTRADGVMCTTEEMREILDLKYGITRKETLVVGNYPLSSFHNVKYWPKLSASDGAIHCVYEGTIVDRAGAEDAPYRFFEPIFVELARAGVHVHIYSSHVPDYLEQLDREYPLIHYEGNYSGEELISRMTQYDLGLAVFPLKDTTYMNIMSLNKLCEYLSAGLPVVTNFPAWVNFVVQNQCGGAVNMEGGDIPAQLRRCMEIKIPEDFCDTHGLTMDANAGRILEFYKRVIEA